MTSLPRLSAAAALAAAALAAASVTPARSATPTPSDKPSSIHSASVDGAKIVAPRRVVLNGQITCTKGAHFHVNGFVLDSATGALAKGKTPPKLPKRSAAYARYKQVTRCTGEPQTWSLVALSSGHPPLPFAPGPLKACALFDVTKHHRFGDLKEVCNTVNA